MKKKSLITLALLFGLTSGANAEWWNDENSDYSQFSRNYGYSQEDEDLALQMAIAASLHDLNTADNLDVADDIWKPALERTLFVREEADVNIWLNRTFDNGLQDAADLVNTQRTLDKTYGRMEDKEGTAAAQAKLMLDANLSDDELLAYVLQLSLLDR